MWRKMLSIRHVQHIMRYRSGFGGGQVAGVADHPNVFPLFGLQRVLVRRHVVKIVAHPRAGDGV